MTEPASEPPIERLLARACAGSALAELAPRIHTELHGIARCYMADQRADHARRRGAEKRLGAQRRVPLGEVLECGVVDDGSTMIALHEAFGRLAASDPAAARVAEMRIFGGLGHRELARVLGRSTRSVDRLWQTVRARLQVEFDLGN